MPETRVALVTGANKGIGLQFDGGKRVPATVSAIADAVRWAEEIMKAIDERWPTSR